MDIGISLYHTLSSVFHYQMYISICRYHTLPFQCWDRLYTSDVCGRQILTYKDGPRTERIKIFIIVVDP